MRKTGHSGITRTASGRLKRVEDPTSPTLKRSFEVDEADAPIPPLTRRTSNPHLRSPVSTPGSTPSLRNPESNARPAHRSNLPRPDNSSSSVTRLSLRKSEAASQRKADPTSGRGQESTTTTRRAEPGPAPTTYRRAELTEPGLTRTTDVSDPSAENNQPGSPSLHLSSPPASPEPRPQSPHQSEFIPAYTSTMSEATMPTVDFSYVGIDAILEQMRRKAMKQGFEFNIMVVGQSGLGKSTLVNTLFKSKVSRSSTLPVPEERIPRTVEIKSISHDIEEKGVKMKLTVIDTPGFGDQINNVNCWKPIMRFIKDQYEHFLQEELNIERKKHMTDSRVHCCIYFIPPTGHCLRPLDVEFMSRLSKVVNIVPVIAKADTLTLEEREMFKQKIREQLLANDIDVYPQKEFDEDLEERVSNDRIREMIPFAVVGSDHEYQINSRRLLGRKTNWGTIEVENTAHCEFAFLRDLLIRTHMQNIKDITSSIHYEAYRVRRLSEASLETNGLSEHDVTVTHEM